MDKWTDGVSNKKIVYVNNCEHLVAFITNKWMGIGLNGKTLKCIFSLKSAIDVLTDWNDVFFVDFVLVLGIYFMPRVWLWRRVVNQAKIGTVSQSRTSCFKLNVVFTEVLLVLHTVFLY